MYKLQCGWMVGDSAVTLAHALSSVPSPFPIPASLTCDLPLPRQYMVLVPFLIHTNVPEKVCIQLTHLNESVTLSATLEYAGANRSLIADVVSEKDVFKCIPFTVSI